MEQKELIENLILINNKKTRAYLCLLKGIRDHNERQKVIDYITSYKKNTKFLTITEKIQSVLVQLHSQTPPRLKQTTIERYEEHIHRIKTLYEYELSKRNYGTLNRYSRRLDSILHSIRFTYSRDKRVAQYLKFLQETQEKFDNCIDPQEYMRKIDRQFIELSECDELTLGAEVFVRSLYRFTYKRFRCKICPPSMEPLNAQTLLEFAFFKNLEKAMEPFLKEIVVKVVKFPHFGLSGSASTSSTFKVNYKL